MRDLSRDLYRQKEEPEQLHDDRGALMFGWQESGRGPASWLNRSKRPHLRSTVLPTFNRLALSDWTPARRIAERVEST
jgi:hypothetical protein